MRIAPGSQVVTAYPARPAGLTSKLRHRIGIALDHYGFRPGRDLAVRVDALGSAVDEITKELSELRDALIEATIPRVTSESSGQLVVSRYRPVLTRASVDPGSSAQLLESVKSDVGTLLFPAFDRFILPSIREYGWWEPDEAAYLRSHLHPGMRVIDVGAHVGYTALVMAEALRGQGLILAFEPEPLNFDLLSANIRTNNATTVVPINAAAGDRTGSVTLQRSPDNTGDHRTVPHPLGIAPLEVPLVALDDLLPPDQMIDFVFVDAQGFDHRVLRGMAKTIDRCRPPMLLEFWPVGIMELGDDPDQVLQEYRSLGYRIELLPDTDVTLLSAEEILKYGEKDHVTLLLVP